MKATIRPFYQVDGTYLVGIEFDVDPSEVEDVSEESVSTAAHWAAGMARTLWLQSSHDIDTMAWVDATRVPDDPSGLAQTVDEGEDE